MHTGGVNFGYLGIGLVLLIGIAVVVYGWLADRVDTQRRQEALTSAPDRAIPGLDASAASPEYRTEDELLRGADVRRPEVPAEAVARALRRLAGSPGMAFGHASDDFANAVAGVDELDQPNLASGTGFARLRQRSGGSERLCVLGTPRILVCDSEINSIRELIDFLAKAQADRAPVVIVAPSVASDVLATLRVNSVQGHVACAVVLIPDATKRAQFASLVGAMPVGVDDLRAGYLPSSALGTCGTWVSSRQQLWVVGE